MHIKNKPELASLANSKVRIYWNSHRKMYSVQAQNLNQWVVVGHTPCIELLNARFIVSKAGHARMMKEGVKNVHAFIVGTLINVQNVQAPEFVRYFGGVHATRRISYSRSDGCFVVTRNMVIWPIGESAQVWATTVDCQPVVHGIYLYDEERKVDNSENH